MGSRTGCLNSFSSRKMLAALQLVFYCCLLSLLSGCIAAGSGSQLLSSPACDDLPALENGGRVSLFLNLARPGVPHLKVNIQSIELLADGQWLPIIDHPKEIDTDLLGDGQIFLGRRVVPAGDYRRIRLTVSTAAVVNTGGDMSLLVEQPDIEISLSSYLSLASEDSKTILLEWDADGALSGSSLQSLAITGRFFGVAPLLANLVYVACPEINTVYVVRTDKNMVVSSISVPGRPTYLHVDRLAKKLFILAADESQIKVFDLISYQMIDRIKIPMTIRPVFMEISPDSQNAYVIDSRSNLLLIDLMSGNMLARKRIGQRAEFATYLPLLQKLAVSSQIEQSVYLVNKDDLTIEETITTTNNPEGLLESGQYLYIAEEMANTVAVYDLANRITVKRLSVGYSPRRLVADRNNIFVANYEDASVSLVKDGQFSVIKVISVKENKVGEMAIDEKQRLLFVGTGDCQGSLAVIDLASNRLTGKVELGAQPLGLAAIQ